jgi:hypothetical protein
MSLPRPTFSALVANYPTFDVRTDFNVHHSCAVRMSFALAGAITGFLDGYEGRLHRGSLTIASSMQLVNYLESEHVGWTPLRPAGRQAPERDYAGQQGIIFWEVIGRAQQEEIRGRVGPNHIDLWDPTVRSLPRAGGRSMMWAPEHNIVRRVRFWSLDR